MKRNLLEKEIKGKFEINEIQNKAVYNRGKNLIFDAPTASGKTEAILLSIEEGSNVTWMLPTISACTFMYRRLCHDFKHLNVQVSTSTMEETRFVKEGLTRINIITCDPFMVDYMREYVTSGNRKQTTDEVLVLDEIDNYPVKVRTALKHYIKNVYLEQVVLASATLDDELKEVKDDFELIQFSKISNKIRYKPLTLEGYREAVINVIKPNYRKKKIGVISNCVKYMENMKDIIQEIMGVDCHEDMNVIFHHSSLPNEVKFENERRLFEGEYDLLISNDLVSMSVDVDLDILIMDWSDKLNVNIQRMGRLNRKGKRVTFKNLFIIDDGVYPPFIDRNIAESLLYDLELSNGTSKIITSDLVSEWSDMIELEDYSFDNLVEDVKYAINHDEEILLRDVPLVFRYEEIRTVQKRKKGKQIEAERKLMTVDKKMNSIPWVWDTPCSEEDGEKDLVYMPWMYDIDHPSGVHSSAWMIVNYDQESGIRTIVPHDGPQYEYYGDVDDSDDENYWDEDEPESSSDNIIGEELWEEYKYDEEGPNGEPLEYWNVGPSVYSYRQTDLDEDVYRENSIKLALTLLNELLRDSKTYKYPVLNEKSMNENGALIVNNFFVVKDYNPHLILKVLGNKLFLSENEDDLNIFKSHKAALKIVQYRECKTLEFNLKWLALNPVLKKYWIEKCESKVISTYGDVDHSLIEIVHLKDPEWGYDVPVSFKYKELVFQIPKDVVNVYLEKEEEKEYDEDNEVIRRELELMGYYDNDDDDDE